MQPTSWLSYGSNRLQNHHPLVLASRVLLYNLPGSNRCLQRNHQGLPWLRELVCYQLYCEVSRKKASNKSICDVAAPVCRLIVYKLSTYTAALREPHSVLKLSADNEVFNSTKADSIGIRASKNARLEPVRPPEERFATR